MLKFYKIYFLLLFIVYGCKTTQQSKGQLYPIISFEKTGCLGTCPSYQFKAFPDGTVSYIGKNYVELIGEYKSTLSQEKLSSLRALLDNANFFDFANVYSASIKDIPTTFIYYDNGTQNMKITDHYGAPESLKKLEDEVEKFITSIEWKKI